MVVYLDRSEPWKIGIRAVATYRMDVLDGPIIIETFDTPVVFDGSLPLGASSPTDAEVVLEFSDWDERMPATYDLTPMSIGDSVEVPLGTVTDRALLQGSVVGEEFVGGTDPMVAELWLHPEHLIVKMTGSPAFTVIEIVETWGWRGGRAAVAPVALGDPSERLAMFRTRITELYGVEHPIVQGGLQAVAIAELTAAVANAGAMGFMTALSYETPEDLRKGIAECRDLTDRPFGVNITLLPSLTPPDYPGYLRVCAEEGIEFLETAGRSPEPFMDVVREAGIKVTHKCTSIRHALKAQSVGVHAISIDGFECAGHPGEDDVTSLILVPLAADALDIPVLASGGFGDGRGLVAALALGAEGINMGTRFVATAEAPVHPAAKQAMVDHGELDTTLVMRTLRNTARVLSNEMAGKVIEVESRPGETDIADLIPFVAGSETRSRVWAEGEIDGGIVAAGQVMGLIRDIPTVKELVERIVADAEAIVSGRLPEMTAG